ncbi:hypothetical protein PFICI_10636 [Pestalotiopsis fici W106-1]|uniref:DNA 3'-5' helicase n=1 Tax=Pestalotiopsis fici (strain W106-1 / CGMCC3.15140) TaxID=1229662 RepID=W3WXQ5_PESFW|nr:uncharacterized protein PFICI_10636 [Pestalotiopsis fici W106-1]ETS78574.1 hypothetical protein PFICI_10636 [Pestalotiopsis fici W106-1]
MDDDYDSGDDLFDGVDPDQLATSQKRTREAHSNDELQEAKRVKITSSGTEVGELIDLARSILHEKFGHDSFRHEQEKAIDAILNGHNALTIFPTGGGKSLCYQIPAVAFEEMDKQSNVERDFGSGITIVVSPLIALMKDQTDALKAKGIAAECSDSTKTYEENQQIHADIHSGRLRLLYCSPEKLNNEAFVASIKHVPGGIRLIAVDEAHCISEWGASFRPEYLKVARFTKEIKAERVICLTATATPRVMDDICQAFAIDKPFVFRTSPYRSNLQLLAESTLTKQDKYPKLFQFLNDHPGPTLVYVTLQKQAEDMARDLTKQGFEAEAFHAGMDAKKKAKIQERFMASKLRIVVATIAFGMGVDKSNIRNIVNWDLPSTVEEYSQQVGRAGRDGLPSTCLMYVCPDDFYIRENFARGDLPSKLAVRAALEDVFTSEVSHEFEGNVLKLGHSELSRTHDIRMSPLAVLFATLELRFGLLRAITPEYTSWKFKDRGAYVPISQQDRSPAAKAIVSYSKKALTLYHFNPKEAMAATGILRSDLMNKINEWHNRGAIELNASGVVNRYRILDQLPSNDVEIDALTEELYADMQNREKDALNRMQQVVNLVTGRQCFAFALAEHFGMGLPSGKNSCGHCTFCMTKQPVILPNKTIPPVDFEGIKEVLAACDVRDDPRFLARVAFGIKSPRVTSLKLANNPVFGSLIEQPFDSLLKEFEHACKSAQYGAFQKSSQQPAKSGSQKKAKSSYSAPSNSSSRGSRGKSYTSRGSYGNTQGSHGKSY